MKGKRKQQTAAFKAQVALAALKGDRTVNELASHYGVPPTFNHAWKKQLLTGAEEVFRNGARPAAGGTAHRSSSSGWASNVAGSSPASGSSSSGRASTAATST